MARSKKAKAKAKVKTVAAAGTLAPTSPHQEMLTLQEEQHWLLRQIRRKRTELNNFMTQMQELATELLQQGSGMFTQMEEMDTEIHGLFEELMTKRKMGKRSRQQVMGVYQMLQFQGTISFQRPVAQGDGNEFFETFADIFEDFPGSGFPGEGAKSRAASSAEGTSHDKDPETVTESTSLAPDRTFRQIFLRLAAIYHPDRATDQDAQQRNTEVMKAINQAYKSGDFARLLELEQQEAQGRLLSDLAAVSDDLAQQCQQLMKENTGLREQYEGIKAELRELRNNTQEGMMVSAYRKATKEGVDFISEVLAETDAELAKLENVRNFVRDFRDRKITLKAFLAGPPQDFVDDMEVLMEQLLGIRIIRPDSF